MGSIREFNTYPKGGTLMYIQCGYQLQVIDGHKFPHVWMTQVRLFRPVKKVFGRRILEMQIDRYTNYGSSGASGKITKKRRGLPRHQSTLTYRGPYNSDVLGPGVQLHDQTSSEVGEWYEQRPATRDRHGALRFNGFKRTDRFVLKHYNLPSLTFDADAVLAMWEETAKTRVGQPMIDRLCENDRLAALFTSPGWLPKDDIEMKAKMHEAAKINMTLTHMIEAIRAEADGQRGPQTGLEDEVETYEDETPKSNDRWR